MYAIPIRDIYSHNTTKPRMFDVIIDDDGDVFIATKNGNTRHIVLLTDVELQVRQYLPEFRIPPYIQRLHNIP